MIRTGGGGVTLTPIGGLKFPEIARAFSQNLWYKSDSLENTRRLGMTKPCQRPLKHAVQSSRPK